MILGYHVRLHYDRVTCMPTCCYQALEGWLGSRTVQAILPTERNSGGLNQAPTGVVVFDSGIPVPRTKVLSILPT